MVRMSEASCVMNCEPVVMRSVPLPLGLRGPVAAAAAAGASVGNSARTSSEAEVCMTAARSW
eukprot:scaffold53196_cov28-Tisochrysis_lutea.AAC.4